MDIVHKNKSNEITTITLFGPHNPISIHFKNQNHLIVPCFQNAY
jgi:hypothetical protein